MVPLYATGHRGGIRVPFVCCCRCRASAVAHGVFVSAATVCIHVTPPPCPRHIRSYVCCTQYALSKLGHGVTAVLVDVLLKCHAFDIVFRQLRTRL